MPNQIHLEKREISFNKEACGNVCSRKTAWEKPIIILQYLLCADAELQYFGHLMRKLTHWERPWCWERSRAGGEEDNRGWDGWMVSPTQWTWVWASSRSWWWTGKPRVHGVTESDTTEWLNLTMCQALHSWLYVILTCVIYLTWIPERRTHLPQIRIHLFQVVR